MKVLPVNNIYTNYHTTQKRVFNSRPHIGMGFDTVSFRGNDLLDLPKKEVYKQVIESITPKNFIGQGTEGEVYRIKNSDYCIKIPYEFVSIFSDKMDLNKVLFFNKNIQPAQKVNHIEAELSYNSNIMKYIEGVPLKSAIYNQEKRYAIQKEISKMPVKSYSNLLHQIANGIDNDMLLDFSPGNLIINKKENKLTAIDFIPLSEDSREVRPLNDMYSAFTVYGAEQETGRKIFENIMDAGLEEFKNKKTPCLAPDLFDFTELIERRCQDSNKQNTDRLMQKITSSIKMMKELKKVEYLEDLFSTFVDEKAAEVKDLIKHIK